MKISRTVILAGSAELAEELCSRLRKPGVYLPVIEAPLVRLVEYGIFDADCIRVANAVRALKPRVVLFVQLDQQVATRLAACFPEIQPVHVERLDERLLTKYVELSQRPVKCRALLADGPNSHAAALFVMEGTFDISHVIAANLAVAHGGRLVPTLAVSDQEVNALREKSRAWSNGSHEEREQARRAILECARARLPAWLPDSSDAHSVSFITRGVPYGVLPFRCPTTHYYSFPLLGLSVLGGMLKCQAHVRCPVAVLMDPDIVGKSEFENLRNTLGKAGYHLRLAYGGGATVRNATYLCQYLPCDLIFFSTHCGELDGARILERFPDRKGALHEICYDRAISICPSPGSELFEVVVLYVPIGMDGVSWADDAGKSRINAGELMKDFLEHTRHHEEFSNKREVLSKRASKSIKGFEALAMSDGNYFPLPQMVGGSHYPVVFNNACSSWRSVSRNFGCNGASVYIGSATDVLNPVAMRVAESFVKAVTSGRSIGNALFKAQKSFAEQFNYTPYLMHGYLHTVLSNPAHQFSHLRVVEKVRSAVEAAKRLPAANKHAAVVRFLEQELSGLLDIARRGT